MAEALVTVLPVTPLKSDFGYAGPHEQGGGRSPAWLADVHLEKKWLAPSANSSIQLSGFNIDDIGTTCEPSYKAPKL